MAWDVEHQMELIPATALRRVMTALAAVWESLELHIQHHDQVPFLSVSLLIHFSQLLPPSSVLVFPFGLPSFPFRLPSFPIRLSSSFPFRLSSSSASQEALSLKEVLCLESDRFWSLFSAV